VTDDRQQPADHPAADPDALPFAKHPLTAEFWDDAHRRSSSNLLGDTTAEDYGRLFNQVGPFDHDVGWASSVLELGPGKGNWFRSLRSGVATFAVEISPVNRKKLADAGLCCNAYAEQDWHHTDCADMAVALSVFQHCDDSTVERLLAVCRRALRVGSALYCNGVAVIHGYQLVEGCVTIHRPLDAMIRMALRAGLSVTGVLEQVAVGQGPLTQWFLRLTRER
jgi:hypothetical protein